MAGFFSVVSLKGRLIRSADSLVDPLYSTVFFFFFLKLPQRKSDQSLPSVSLSRGFHSSLTFYFTFLTYFSLLFLLVGFLGGLWFVILCLFFLFFFFFQILTTY